MLNKLKSSATLENKAFHKPVEIRVENPKPRPDAKRRSFPVVLIISYLFVEFLNTLQLSRDLDHCSASNRIS